MEPQKLAYLKRRCAEVPLWWHQIPICEDFRTPGSDPYDFSMWKASAIPNVKDKTVLDIGAWDGFFTFLCAERGASKVLATDSMVSGHEGKGFRVARDLLLEERKPVVHTEMVKSDIQYAKDLGLFDVVLCLGVIYHLEGPYVGMQRMADLTKEVMVLEDHVREGTDPVAYFYGQDELNHDATNYWGMTVPCLLKMGIRAGFKSGERIDKRGDRVLMRFYK